MKTRPLSYKLPATLLMAGITATGIGFGSLTGAAIAQNSPEKNPYKYDKGKYEFDKSKYKYDKGKYEKGKYEFDKSKYKYDKGKYEKGKYKYDFKKGK